MRVKLGGGGGGHGARTGVIALQFDGTAIERAAGHGECPSGQQQNQSPNHRIRTPPSSLSCDQWTRALRSRASARTNVARTILPVRHLFRISHLIEVWVTPIQP